MGTNEQNNFKDPRRKLNLMKIWITEAEEESLKESLEDPTKYEQNVIEIFEEVKKRGDIQWTKSLKK